MTLHPFNAKKTRLFCTYHFHTSFDMAVLVDLIWYTTVRTLNTRKTVDLDYSQFSLAVQIDGLHVQLHFVVYARAYLALWLNCMVCPYILVL